MCDVVHSLGKVLKNLIWRQATSGIAVGMHTPRRHPVDSAPWTNSFQRPTPWWRKEDSNPRSLSREIRLSGAREVPGAVKTGKPRKASFVLRGTKGSNPSPSSGESIANLFGPETSWVVPHVADPRAH